MMKLRNFTTLCLVAALFLCCEKDEGFLGNTQGTLHPINISGSIDQEYITRVDDGGFCDGDQVGLYGVNWLNDNTQQGTLQDSGNQVDNARYTYNEQSNMWNATGNIYYKDAETNIDLYAYYPYDTPGSVTGYAFEVHQDQSGANTVEGYALSDFLWAKAENVVPTENKVRLKFSHRLSCANVVLVEGEGFACGEFEAMKKSVLVMNTSRTASINLQTGTATVTGEPENEGIVMMNSADGFRAIVVPQTVPANAALFSITIDGITYRFKKEAAFTYEAGMQALFTIELNKKSHSGELELNLVNSEIKPWIADSESHNGNARQYYVVHMEEPGTLEQLLKDAKKDPNKITNLKVSGKICGFDFLFMRDNMANLEAINLKETKIIGVWMASYYLDHVIKDSYFYGNIPTPDKIEDVVKQFANENYPEQSFYWINSYNTVYNQDEIPVSAFNGKQSLKYFSFPEVVTSLGDFAFTQTSLEGALIIPDGVVEIGSSCFSNTNITSVQFPSNLEIIKNYAFDECEFMYSTITLPETLISIGQSAFSYCPIEGHLKIPSRIKEIPEFCFSNTNISSLELPDGLEIIGEGAFARNEKLKGTLILPKTLKTIGSGAFSDCRFQGQLFIPANVRELGGFGQNDFSSVVFEEGSRITTIESQAFNYCKRISEPIILPESVSIIGANAFNGSSIPAIVLPESLTVISNEAFYNCFDLTSLTCNATNPPKLGSNVFNGVAKNNFTLKVPASAVSKYQTATGWKDFKRIGAHYDFVIERPLMRALNAPYSKTYLLRAPADGEWNVTLNNCLEWVTVSPMSGTGRADVTITINELPQRSGNRSGEIVFTLNKEFNSEEQVTSTMKVEQYDYEHYDGEVIANQIHSIGDGVNLVFMGDCFDAKDISEGKYLQGINQAIEHFFAIEPYKSYKDYFNVYTVVGMSPESGMGTVNTIKEAKFGSQYSLEGITPDTGTIYEYAMKANGITEKNLNKTLVVMVENTQDYGGICYMWGDGSAIAICPMSADAYPFDFRGIVQHEAGGHGFGKLADEYIYSNAFIELCLCPYEHLVHFDIGKARGWYRNLSKNNNYHTVEWAHLFANPLYSNTVDMYEGGFFHTRGIYRSENNSCMNNNVPYYSAISRQEIVERIIGYSGGEFSLEDFYAKDVRDASGNITKAASANTVGWSSAGKQMPPKFMGEKPVIRKKH